MGLEATMGSSNHLFSVGSERTLLEIFNLANMEKTESEKGQSEEFRTTKKFIIELLHSHWYHETNRMVEIESYMSDGYKLAKELTDKHYLENQKQIEASRLQQEKIVALQNQLETERRKYNALETQYKLLKPNAEKLPTPSLDVSSLNALFSSSLLNSPVDDDTPYYKTCVFGELDESVPVFEEPHDENLQPHFVGGYKMYLDFWKRSNAFADEQSS